VKLRQLSKGRNCWDGALDESERLQNEKLALGFYYSGHPFKFYEDEFSSVVRTRLSRLLPPPPEEGRGNSTSPASSNRSACRKPPAVA